MMIHCIYTECILKFWNNFNVDMYVSCIFSSMGHHPLSHADTVKLRVHFDYEEQPPCTRSV